MLSAKRDNMSEIYQNDRKENNRVCTYPFQKYSWPLLSMRFSTVLQDDLNELRSHFQTTDLTPGFSARRCRLSEKSKNPFE
jgi:hypothetical protein